MMKTQLLFIFIMFQLTLLAQCDAIFVDEYDEFDKKLESEFDYRVVFTTWESDEGVEYQGEFFQIGWSDTFYNYERNGSLYGWFENSRPNVGEGALKIYLFYKHQIKDCLSYDCWQFSDTKPRIIKDNKEAYDFQKWEPYLKNEIDNLYGYGYVQFLATNDEVLKVHIFYGDHGTGILLNNTKYPRTIDNYNWLKSHNLKKIRFHNAQNNKNLDVNIPTEEMESLAIIISCVEEHKRKISKKYQTK